MKKYILFALCLLTLLGLAGCKRDKTNNDVPATDKPGNGSSAGDMTPTTPDSGSTAKPDQSMGDMAQDALDKTEKAVRDLWDDMQVAAANLTDVMDQDAAAVLEEWGLDRTLLEDYTVKRYTDDQGGRLILARVKAGHAAEVAAALQAKGVNAQVWENGNYVLIADTDRVQDIVTRFKALTF